MNTGLSVVRFIFWISVKISWSTNFHLWSWVCNRRRNKYITGGQGTVVVVWPWKSTSMNVDVEAADGGQFCGLNCWHRGWYRTFFHCIYWSTAKNRELWRLWSQVSASDLSCKSYKRSKWRFSFHSFQWWYRSSQLCYLLNLECCLYYSKNICSLPSSVPTCSL